MSNMTNQRASQWLAEVRVLDGGFGTECQKRSHLQIHGHMAWSSRLLKEDPELIVEIHKSFLRAGCDVISTNTYQASPTTLVQALNITKSEAENLMHTAVILAKRACEEEKHSDNCNEFQRKLPVLIAGSLGPYGACIADGSEYTGSYADTVTFDELVEFHLSRANILIQSGVDFIAWETVPLLIEVSAICEVMRRLPSAYCWISVSSPDGKTTSGGDLLVSVAQEVKKCDQVFGVGVNCNIPHDHIGEALENLCLHKTTDPGSTPNKLLLFYANDGRLWVRDDDDKGKSAYFTSHSHYDDESWLQSTIRWAKCREVNNSDDLHQSRENNHNLAQWVGGCCNVGPDSIKQLARWMKPDEFIVS